MKVSTTIVKLHLAATSLLTIVVAMSSGSQTLIQYLGNLNKIARNFDSLSRHFNCNIFKLNVQFQ